MSDAIHISRLADVLAIAHEDRRTLDSIRCATDVYEALKRQCLLAWPSSFHGVMFDGIDVFKDPRLPDGMVAPTFSKPLPRIEDLIATMKRIVGAI